MLVILYSIIALIIVFIVSKVKPEWVWEDNFDMIHPALIFIVFASILWIFTLPAYLLWKLLDKIYNNFF